MFSTKIIVCAVAIVVFSCCVIEVKMANDDYYVDVCVDNCDKCEKRYGDNFEAIRCIEHCIRVKGKKRVPNCDGDMRLVQPFLNVIYDVAHLPY